MASNHLRWATVFLFALACGDDADLRTDGSVAGCAVAADCDDAVFCNGREACVAGVCETGEAPCPVGACDERADVCAVDCADADADGDGEESLACGGTDCDDSDPAVNSGASEVCDAEGTDEDCDPTTFGFVDRDMDGLGDAACCNGDLCGRDCDDGDDNVGRGLPEACDGLDNDCDGETDEGALTVYWPDTDGDDFGDAAGTPRMACSQPDGFSENDDDCDDDDGAVHPGAAEICDGSGDNDCNPSTPSPFDSDGDGHDAYDAISCPLGTDCNPSEASSYEGAPELCDGLDTNCDGAELGEACACDGTCSGLCELGTCSTPDYATGLCEGTCPDGFCVGTCDMACPVVSSGPYPLEDFDDDGELAVGATCVGGPRGDLPRTDCNDADPEVGANADEVCDGIDNDCDTRIDELLTGCP